MQDVYLDTSALRQLSFNRDLAILLHQCKIGQIRVYISEAALWERGRQQYESDFKNDRVVPYKAELSSYLAWFKLLFEGHCVIIIQSSKQIMDKTDEYMRNENTYFNVSDVNDQRDACVLATAETSLDKNTIILCGDKELADEFGAIGGFQNILRGAKTFVEQIQETDMEIPVLDKPDLSDIDDYQRANTFSDNFKSFIGGADQRSLVYLKELPSISDRLTAKLQNMQIQDAEIRKRILGYVRWFSPIGKSELLGLLIARNYQEEPINNNAARLVEEQLLLETDHAWMANNKSDEAKIVCEQAMSLVMPEILEIMELN